MTQARQMISGWRAQAQNEIDAYLQETGRAPPIKEIAIFGEIRATLPSARRFVGF